MRDRLANQYTDLVNKFFDMKYSIDHGSKRGKRDFVKISFLLGEIRMLAIIFWSEYKDDSFLKSSYNLEVWMLKQLETEKNNVY